MPTQYLSGSDLGLVRQGADRRAPTDTGRVEITRQYRCRISYAANARQLLVPGAVLESGSPFKLENPPQEQEEPGWMLFTCLYVGVDPNVPRKDPPRVKSTNYVVLTVREVVDAIPKLYTVRVGYPTFTYQSVTPKESALAVELPSYNENDFVLQLLGTANAEADATSEFILVARQQTGNEEIEYVDVVDRKASYSWVPFAHPRNEQMPGGSVLLVGSGYRGIWAGL